VLDPVRKENALKTGWKLVARLGMSGPGYPHLLVDRHGWCLRFGPNPRVDDKFYSRLLFLMEGLVEQGLRRAVLTIPAATEIGELRAILRESLRSTVDLGERLEKVLRESPIRPLDARNAQFSLPTRFPSVTAAILD
jgi:hypothetical protein